MVHSFRSGDVQIEKSQVTTSAQEKSNPLLDAARALAYTAIQSPLSSLAQLADQVGGKRLIGKEILPSVQFIDAPMRAKSGSSNWYGQQIGAAVGALPWFLALRKSVGALATRFNSTLVATEIGKSTGAGMLYGGLLKPVAPNEGPWAGRLRNAAVDGLTFGVLTASMGRLRSLADNVGPTRPWLNSLIRNDVAGGAAAGLPAGLVNAEAHSLLHGRGFANRQELKESILAMSVVGGVLGAGHKLAGMDLPRLRRAGSAEDGNSIADSANRNSEVPARSISAPGEQSKAAADKSEPVAGPKEPIVDERVYIDPQQALVNAVFRGKRSPVPESQEYTDLTVEPGQTLVAEPGMKITVTGGGKVVAKPGSDVEAIGTEVVAVGEASITALPGSRVVAKNGARIDAYDATVESDGCNVEAWENARVKASNSEVNAAASSKLEALQGTRYNAWKDSDVIARDGSEGTAHPGARVDAHSGAFVTAKPGSIVIARQGTQVVAEDGSIVYEEDGAIIFASDGAQIKSIKDMN